MLSPTIQPTSPAVVKVVQLVTDDREPTRQYGNPNPFFGAAPTALFEGFSLLPEIAVHVVSCTQQPMQAPEKLAENIWFHNLHVPKFGWMRTAYQGCIRAMRRKIREIAPDIVHGQGTERDGALGAVFSGCPNVVTIHGNMAAMPQYQDSTFALLFSRCAALLETIALRRTQGVLCNSAYTESLVLRNCRNTWRVPNALRKRFFDLPVQAAPVGTVPILLNVGTIVPRKAQVALLDLARDLHARGARFILKFIGGLDLRTPYGRTFNEKLSAARAAGYAEYIGTFELKELIQQMDASSALIHVPEEEAFGLVVPEALARNLKFFGTKTGGVMDIAADVEGAELFAPGAWTELGQAITQWLASGAPRPVTASNVMRARYHPEVVARRHLEIYRELLQRR